jgi:HEAT repeat protein
MGGDPNLASLAAQALGGLGDAGLAVLSEGLDGGPIETQRAAARALRAIPLSRSRPTLEKLIGHPDPLVRLAGAEGLAKGKDSSAAKQIVPLLLDPNDTVRLGIPRILKDLDLFAAEPFREILAMEATPVSRTEAGRTVTVKVETAKKVAVETLITLKGVPVIAPLLLALDLSNKELQSLAKAHLREQLEDKACRVECQRLSLEGTPRLRLAALRTLADLAHAKRSRTENESQEHAPRGPEDIPDLKENLDIFAKALGDPHAPIKLQGALALCLFGDGRGKPLVIEAVREKIREVLGPSKDQGRDASRQAALTQLPIFLNALLPVADVALAEELLPLLKLRGSPEGPPLL